MLNDTAFVPALDYSTFVRISHSGMKYLNKILVEIMKVSVEMETCKTI